MENILLFLAQPFFLIFNLLVNLKVFLSINFLNLKEDVPAIINVLNFCKDTFAIYLTGYRLFFTLKFLLMWFPNINPFIAPYYIVYVLTEPLLAKIREYIPPIFGIDLSFILATLGIDLLANYLLKFHF